MQGLTAANTFLNLLLAVGALGLALQAFIGLSFFISSVWEKEPRATFFAALQAGGMVFMLAVYLVLIKVGFFGTAPGVGFLVLGYLFALAAADQRREDHRLRAFRQLGQPRNDLLDRLRFF